MFHSYPTCITNPEGKYGLPLHHFCSVSYLKGRSPNIGEKCCGFKGSSKQDCPKCSGYGYLESTKTEYYDGSFCGGKGLT